LFRFPGIHRSTTATKLRFANLLLAFVLAAGPCQRAGAGERPAIPATSGTGSAMTGNEQLEDALKRHVAALTVDIGERTSFLPDKLARAREYVRDELANAGLEVTEQGYDYRGQRVANLIAALPGASMAKKYYLVGAHYDTVPGTPGADDNASAVAVLIELGRRVALAPPPIPLRLVAFTLEEPPAFNTRFQGSRVFVRQLKRDGGGVKGAIILEMVGFTAAEQDYPLVLHWIGYPKEGNFIGIVGNRRSRRLGRTLAKSFGDNPRLPVETLFVPFNGLILPATRLSDHAPFWDAGLPALMVTDTAFFRNPFYHTALDRMETLDFAFMAEVVASLRSALDALPPGE
jgi:hypothetical protein